MQTKIYSVSYVDGKPVDINETKTFINNEEYKAFKKTCEKNKELLSKDKEIENLEKEAQIKEEEKTRSIFKHLIAFLVYEHKISMGEIDPKEDDGKLYQKIIKMDLKDMPKEYEQIFGEFLERVK